MTCTSAHATLTGVIPPLPFRSWVGRTSCPSAVSGVIAFFDDAYRAEVLEAVTVTVAGQVPVIAGVIDTQTRRVIQHLRAAERFDLGGFVATAPFNAVTGPEEIDAHFRAVAAAADAPV